MRIALNGIKIFAHHGWYAEEALLGGYFLVDIAVTLPAVIDSDDLSDTLNYELLHDIVLVEMKERSKLLEHVISRIKSNLISSHPHKVRALSLSIKKLNPPFGLEIESTQVSIEEDYSKTCAKCNDSFSCFSSQDCWCKTINLSDVTRSNLQRQYTGCLCQRCLTQFAEHPSVLLNL